MHKAIEPTIVACLGFFANINGVDVIYSLMMAFGCGLMAWLARELGAWCKSKFKK